MKAKATTKAASKATATSTQGATGKTAVASVIKVPAAMLALVKGSGVIAGEKAALIKRETKTRVDLALLCRKLYATKEAARPVLVQAYADAGLKDKEGETTFSSYRTKVLTMAFPEKATAEAVDTAIADGLDENKIYAVATGGLKKSKRKEGGYIKVTREENRGGKNKVKPLDAADAQFALAFSHGIDEEQTAVLIAKHAIAAKLDVLAIAKALKLQAD